MSGLSYLVQTQDVATIIKQKSMQYCLLKMSDYIHEDYQKWSAFDKSPRVAKYTTNGVCELMPVANKEQYAFKYVNCHPLNPNKGMSTVLAFGALVDMSTGLPEFVCEMTILTALRTAATSLMVARYLARKSATTMAIIGNGCQSEFQALAFYYGLGIKTLHLYDIDRQASEKLKRNLAHTDLDIKIFDTVQDAVKGVDIITTITAEYSRAHIITAAMVEPGMFINAVGGDSPGKTELDPAILQQADGVYVELEEQTRVEGELQNQPEMFHVKHVYQLMDGQDKGRQNDHEVLVFDSVGFAVEDYSALKFIKDCALELGAYEQVNLVPDMQDPKDLYGYVDQLNQ